MKDGLAPALISDTRAGVSLAPSIIKRPGEAVGDETPCEIRTRVVSRLGGCFEELDEPQEIKLKLTTMRLQNASTRVKREAPKDMKNLDLSARLGIIADRYPVLALRRALLKISAGSLHQLNLEGDGCNMPLVSCILIPYGGLPSRPNQAVRGSLGWCPGDFALRQRHLYQP